MKLFNRHPLYLGEVVSLRQSYHLSAELYDVETIVYDIIRNDDNQAVGTIDLRMDSTGFMYYYGNVGYHIFNEYRGNGYAYYANKVLMEIAKVHLGFSQLIITCSPDNLPSLKTIKKLDGEFLEMVEVPIDHELYARGETIKNIYRIIL